jgi:hypothetical protein
LPTVPDSCRDLLRCSYRLPSVPEFGRE